MTFYDDVAMVMKPVMAAAQHEYDNDNKNK